MRAILNLDHHKKQDELVLKNETHHHLTKVVRSKEGDSILLLNGNGARTEFKIKKIEKKRTIIICTSNTEVFSRKYNLDIMIGKTKRDALDTSIKSLTEIGLSELMIVNTEFSQRYELNIDRLNKLTKSSLEQSNSLFLPKISELSFKDLLIKAKSNYDKVYYFSSIKKEKAETACDLKKRNLIIIGPEGGMSSEEERQLSKLENIEVINLPTPIMRAQNAAILSCGFLMGMTW